MTKVVRNLNARGYNGPMAWPLRFCLTKNFFLKASKLLGRDLPKSLGQKCHIKLISCLRATQFFSNICSYFP